jgi:hypothetical protein
MEGFVRRDLERGRLRAREPARPEIDLARYGVTDLVVETSRREATLERRGTRSTSS